jgi:Domain of unknown function (DUF929)
VTNLDEVPGTHRLFRKVSILSPTTQSNPARRQSGRRLSPAFLAWCGVSLVVVIVAVLVIVKITGGSGPSSSSHRAVFPASPSLVQEISTVPAPVFDTVGVGIPSQLMGNPPIVISGQPPLTLNGSAPSIMYYGAEYCPYCAAQRWSIAVALARFGTWSGLDTTASGLNDGDYSTLSFRSAKLTSQYINFVPIEACTNVVNPNVVGCSGYSHLQSPNRAEQAVLDKYASSTFVPGNVQGVSFPYIDVDNRVLYSGSTYQPSVLTGLTQAEIAGRLTDPTNLVTQAIIGTANYVAASVCASTRGAPAIVCTSPGVESATRAMKLS